MASVFFMFAPAWSARKPAAWIAGPSAIGSVNGMPSSITSAPAFGSACRIGERRRLVGIARHGEGDERGAAFFFAAPQNADPYVPSLRFASQMVRHQIEVLVAAAGEIDHHQVILRLLRRELEHLGDGMGRLERRDDAFELGEKLERVERFVVGRRRNLMRPASASQACSGPMPG